MKKIFTLLISLLVGLTWFSASPAGTMTINVDHADNVLVGYMSSGFVPLPKYYALTDGQNVVEIKKETAIFVRPAKENLDITVKVDNNAVGNLESIPVVDGMTVDITTGTVTTASACTVNCDDFNLVALTVGATPVELTSNSQRVEFNAGDTFVIRAKDGDGRLTGVKLDGTDIAAGADRSFTLTGVAEGSVIDITAIVRYHNLAFDFNDDNARRYITAVTVDGDEAPDYAAGLRVHANAYISMAVDKSITDVEVTVNGEKKVPGYAGSIDFLMTGDTEVKAATLKGFTFSLTSDDPQRVVAGYSRRLDGIVPQYEEVVLALGEGTTGCTLPYGINRIFIRPAAGCVINSVTVNGLSVENLNEIEIGENDAVNVTSSKPVATGTCTVICADPRRITLKAGDTDHPLTGTETKIDFVPETQGTFLITVNDPMLPIGEITHNGAPVPPQWDGGYKIEGVKDGDVIEVDCPELFPVTFEFTDPKAGTYIREVLLNGTAVEEFNRGFTAAEKSMLVLNVDRTVENVRLTINGEEFEPDKLGNVMHTVDGPTGVKVESTDGIAAVEASAPSTVSVFTTGGVLVLDRADRGSLSSLPAGIYIVNGRKVSLGR